jgi:hypothetical protein
MMLYEGSKKRCHTIGTGFLEGENESVHSRLSNARLCPFQVEQDCDFDVTVLVGVEAVNRIGRSRERRQQ